MHPSTPSPSAPSLQQKSPLERLLNPPTSFYLSNLLLPLLTASLKEDDEEEEDEEGTEAAKDEAVLAL